MTLSRIKWIHDSIHGQIQFDDYCLKVMDTVQFQRLRDLKQLGAAYFVYPGGSHNRFEHSLGVCHLAGSLIERLKFTQPELEITQEDITCIKLAGLCHDLGHGPFSHVFDSEFIPQARPNRPWTHEQGSEMMLEHLIDDNHIDLDGHQIRLIKDLIRGVPKSSFEAAERGFFFDVVANKRNSIDVDKFDYLSRDCHNLGFKSGYDFSRLMNFNRVIDGQICFHSKEVYNIYEMFHTRFTLFKRVYKHRVAKAIEYMITDALLLADPYLKISEAVDSGDQFVHLSDFILKEIEKSNSDELAASREIIYDIRRRNLYRFVDEIIVPTDLRDQVTREQVTPASIIQHHDGSVPLREADVIIDYNTINYSLKDQNPVDNVMFFSRFDDTRSFPIPREKVSHMIPTHFEETCIRIFSRDPSRVADLQKAFRKFVHQLSRRLSIDPSLTIPTGFESPKKKRSEAYDAALAKRHKLTVSRFF